jgi:hypothetical protein
VGKFEGWENKKRGKGGHTLLRRKDPENPNVVLAYPLRSHGTNEDFSDSIEMAVRRKLKMTPEHGVSDADWDAA